MESTLLARTFNFGANLAIIYTHVITSHRQTHFSQFPLPYHRQECGVHASSSHDIPCATPPLHPTRLQPPLTHAPRNVCMQWQMERAARREQVHMQAGV